MKLFNDDCLNAMKSIADNSVDMVLCDLPYGTTKCPWDVIIPFEDLWKEYNRVCKPNAAIVLFGQEPFSSMLRMSNLKDYKYDLYWEKEAPTNVLQLKKRFGKNIETISVFYKKQCTYNPQKYKHEGKLVKNTVKGRFCKLSSDNQIKPTEYIDDGTRYPKQVLRFNRVDKHHIVHPTQKPVELLEYLIKSFTNEGDTVLDNCMGSGSTGVACKNLNRNFIGIEKELTYFEIAKERIDGSCNLFNKIV